MEEMDTYSIETDHMVLLSFRNGRKRRVRADRLAQYLRPQDLQVVQRAMKLRHDFIRSHMPKAAVLLLAAGLLALLALGGRAVAWLFGHSAPGTPGRTMIVRSQAEPQPEAQPAPTSPGATPKIFRPGHHSQPPVYRLVAQHQPVSSLPAPTASPGPAATPSVLPSPSPSPSASPEPQSGQVAGQSPAQQPAPTPSPAPDHGQVLGDSTGPSGS